jgi:predicted amino acid dehydrogenase
MSLKNQLDTRVGTSKVVMLDDPSGLKKADIIIVFTSARGARLQPEYISPGTIIIDDTQPSAISQDLVKNRNDILVVDGGIIHLPGFNPHFKLGLLRKGDMWGCLAETIILTWLHTHGHDIDRLKPRENLEEYLKILASTAETIGFCPAEPRSFSRHPVESDMIEAIKTIRNKRFSLNQAASRASH